MSESPPARRRSQRERKPAQPFLSGNKRKRGESDSEEEVDMPSDPEVESPPSSPAPTPKKKAKATKSTTTKASAKKPRATAAKKTKKTDAFDAGRAANDTGITSDNPLYNATLNPAAALQSIAEDFLESLTESPGSALAELINCILRACGCNDKVDADEVLDFDGVVDSLDNFTEGFKTDNSPVYPLTSKLTVFKKFRKSLSELIERIIASAADLGSLYTTELMETLLAWVVAMSSSHIRSFRHTTTVVALEVETALCEVAAAVEKEAEVVARQKEGEKKRRANGKGTAGKTRDTELEKKADEIRERREKLAEFLKEFVDGVFVHRYRDTDPIIRAECVHALGQWFQKHPGHFLDSSYLRYVGWVLFDPDLKVRIEAIKALAGVYEYGGGEGEANPYIASLNHFTERFKPRLIEMATRDSDASVRIATIAVVAGIDSHSLLEDEEREKMCLLVYDEEKKVRKAVGAFVQGIWEDAVQERLVGKKASAKETKLAGVKALAVLLVKWSKDLVKVTGDASDDEDGMDVDQASQGGTLRANRFKETVSIIGVGQKTRIDFIVEALWDHVDPVNDWDEVLSVIQVDHSAPEETTRSGKKGKAKEAGAVDESWRLEEEEESILLQVLASSVRQAKLNVKKGEEEGVASDITRALIKGLPRLFAKYQTDQSRIADVLSIIPCMNIDSYLDLRMLQAYNELWDEITKQFLSHSSLIVLNYAVASIDHLLLATSLANTNSKKILELDDELSNTLRDAVAGNDQIEVASFTEDEVLKLTAICARINALIDRREMCNWLEDDDEGKQSAGWDIITALLERSNMGYKEEESMAIHALNILTMHVMWKSSLDMEIPEDPSPAEEQLRTSLQEQRNFLLEKLTEYAVGTANTTDAVKRHAFIHLMTLYTLVTPGSADDTDAPPVPSLDEQAQFRCAGFLQAEIERYGEVINGDEEDEEKSDDEASEDEDDMDVDGEESAKKKRKKKKPKKKKAAPKTPKVKTVVQDESDPSNSRERLEQGYVFSEFTSAFLRAIHTGAIHVRHGSSSLMNYGHLDPAFDVHCKAIIEFLRFQGMHNDRGEDVVTIVTESLQNSFNYVLDGIVPDETYTVALAKALVSTLIMKGLHLAVVKRLDSKYVVEVQTKLLTWIGKKLAVYQKKDNKKARTTAITFFRALQPLLIPGIESRDALKIKTHMDQVLAEANVEVSATAKAWEPQRAYEKRLGTLQSSKVPAKGKAKGTVKGKAAKSKATVSDDEDEEDGATTEEERPPTPKPKPKAKPKPKLRPIRATRMGPKPAEEGEDEDEDKEEEEEPSTPKAKSKAKTTYRKKPSPTKSASPARSPTLSPTPPPQSPARSQTQTPPQSPAVSTASTPSKKRGRDDEDEEDVGSSAGSQKPQSQAVVVTRKRARH